MSVFYVAIGGALGAVGRYGVGLWLKTATASGFPWATLSVNIIGSLLMGLLMGWLSRAAPSEPMRLFLAVGVLGGFTTFSAFSLDVFTLIERRDLVLAALYACGSVIGALAAFFLGYAALRSVGG